jgi:hypothetical protein
MSFLTFLPLPAYQDQGAALSSTRKSKLTITKQDTCIERRKGPSERYQDRKCIRGKKKCDWEKYLVKEIVVVTKERKRCDMREPYVRKRFISSVLGP